MGERGVSGTAEGRLTSTRETCRVSRETRVDENESGMLARDGKNH